MGEGGTAGGARNGGIAPRGRGVLMRRAAAAGLGAFVAIALLLVTPLGVSAHSYLVSSQPADGAQLGLAPGAVVLDFSEPLNPTLSESTVSSPGMPAVSAHAVAPREIRVDLVTNAPGVYRVVWVAVSLNDGHTTQGAFNFTVEARSAGTATGSQAGPSASDVAIAVSRWVEDAALLLAIGMLFIRWLGGKDPALDWVVRPRLRPPVVVAFMAGGVVILSEALVASRGSAGEAVSYFGSGLAGYARLARVLLELNAIGAVFSRARHLWPAVAGPIVALAAAGHASGNLAQLGGIALDSAHLVAAGVWAGGIMALATLRPPGGWSGATPLLQRFTPWALGAFTATVGLGFLQAILNLGSIGALTGTAYGRVLMVKAALVALMIPFSLVAWRLRRPRMHTEAGVGVAVVAAAALLASSPVPARGAAPVTGAPAAEVGLPHGTELTLGGHAGQVLLGLTIEPARPGPNKLTAYLLPIEGASAAAALDVGASVDGGALTLDRCGDPCRSTHVSLRGGETVSISVRGVGGGDTSLVVPSLPAADGGGVVNRAVARMRTLHSYAMHETLSSGVGTTVITDYQAAAPDRTAWTANNGAQAISIARIRYNKDNPSAPWVKDTGPPIPEPLFVWDSFAPYASVHIVGHQTLDGVPTTILGFFGGSPATPIWFRLWVDDQALVHRAEMRAPGHFMDQAFHDFNAPLTISAPTGP